MRISHRRFLAIAAAAALCLGAAACKKGVTGHTYQGTWRPIKSPLVTESFNVQVEFGSGGNATVKFGSTSSICTYSQTNQTVSIDCAGTLTQLTVNPDGSLTGPPDSMMAKLTLVK